MVENHSLSSTNVGGRPQEFDRDKVLAAAAFAFWTHGFKATTVAQLEEATGVDRSTLYKSFGGKNGLYDSAADLYLTTVSEHLFCHLHDGSDGIADIVRFIDTLDASYRGGQPRGCFIVNDMGSVDEHEATHRYFDIIETGFRAALERASAAGQTRDGMIEQRTQFLTAAFIGISLTHRNMADPEVTHRLIDGVRKEVETWEGSVP